MLSKVQVKQADIGELEQLTLLFDLYRQFYGRESNAELAREFLRERINRVESVLFIAYLDNQAVGFTQLYPSFSSASLARIFILNDLFVVPDARRKSVATELIDNAARYAKNVGAIRLSLSTAINNKTAQALYEAKGWVRDNEFCEYNFSL